MGDDRVWTNIPIGELTPWSAQLCSSAIRALCDKKQVCGHVRTSGSIWHRQEFDDILARLSGKTEEQILDERMERIGREVYKKCREITVTYGEIGHTTD